MSPLKIILADDHASVRKSLRLLLDCEPDLDVVAETTDGLETIRAVQSLLPDLLVLDIKMPQMSGLEVLQYLRNAKHTLGIIMLSNYSEQLYISAAMRLGADAFITKGAGIDVLLEAIRKIRQRLLDERLEAVGASDTDSARSGRLLTESRAELEQTRQEWYEAS